VFRVTDLKVLSIATHELEASVETFRKNFGLPVTRSATGPSGHTSSVSLGIGGAELEMVTPAGEGSPVASFLAERGPGLHQLVLEVDDLDAAAAELSARGIDVSVKTGADGRSAGLLSAAQTHGVRITLVGR
jgi:methylmalonyl-CoA/ethylmalonyl-CoA epimerase